VHGNAILTKFDWHSYEAIEHSHHPVDWEDPQHGLAKREPRRGRRLTLTADMVLPSGRRLAVYCSHLEVFCGITGRWAAVGTAGWHTAWPQLLLRAHYHVGWRTMCHT
jgi:hypothetical protein